MRPPQGPPPSNTQPGVPTSSAKEDTRPLKFTSSVHLVLVPAVVTDKSGAHVTGLTLDDFSVLENGKEQKIAGLEEIKASDSRIARPKLPPGEFSNVSLSQDTPRSLTIIALDLINTPFLDQTRSREALVAYLAHNVSGNRPTMVLTIDRSGMHVIHDFTSDPAVLVAALRKVRGQIPPTVSLAGPADSDPIDAQTFNAQAMSMEVDQFLAFMEGLDQSPALQRSNLVTDTLESFQHLAQAFAGVPGRKSLIWVTGSFPFDIDSNSSTLLGQGSPLAFYERTFQMLNDANIAVYPVDARGLVVVGLPDASVRTTRAMNRNPSVYMSNALGAHADTITTLEQVAGMTGGRAFYNTNDLEGAFRQAAGDSTQYYVISYYLDKSNTKPGWRKLTVKVHRGGDHVRARDGFFLTRSLLDPQESHDTDIMEALQSPLEYSALPVTVVVGAAEGSGSKRKVTLEVLVPANAATVDADDGNRISLDFAAVARDDKGEGKAEFSQTLQARLKPAGVNEVRDHGVAYTNTLELAPGEYAVRVVVRDNLNGRMGSVLAPLKVM
ncbi:MAG TPA: VWA domain-containing protein [Terriglobales bacterium]|jgi:VWFA-related protein|nr:VWA domain-containing protein [Terriglobales bacterium]